MTARVGTWLGVCFLIAFVTGLISHYAQEPRQPIPFPTRPVWLYQVTQGLHVITGTAEVTVGDKVLMLSENQSTYIPLGETHRLRNPGKVPLEIIEVQSGSYLGEDDIVRFEDTYGRN